MKQQKAERLYNAITHIKDEYITEAPTVPLRRPPVKWQRWAGIAACACLAVAAAALLPHDDPFAASSSYAQSTAPMPAGSGAEAASSAACAPAPTEGPAYSADGLLLLPTQLGDAAQGFEGLMFQDISEFTNGNPWTAETTPDTLPVYRNLAYQAGMGGASAYLTAGEMQAIAQTTAETLGEEIIAYEEHRAMRGDASPEEIKDKTLTEENSVLYGLSARFAGGSIQVDGNGTYSVLYDAPRKVRQSWESFFARLTGFKNPVSYRWGDYTYTGQQTFVSGLYPAGDTAAEQILNYSLRKVAYYPKPDGSLTVFHVDDLTQTTEKLGDYPLITAAQARQQLLAGRYLTTVWKDHLPDGQVTDALICKEELIYLTGSDMEYYLPYYRFWLQLNTPADARAHGLTTYGAYYVPAVHPDYLADVTLWDGSFN